MSKVLGYTKKGDTVSGSSTILGLGALNTSGGTDKLIAVTGTDAYVWNSSTDDWDAQSQSLTASAKAEFVSFLDHSFLVNFSDATRSYTGSVWSTTTNVTDAPKARYIKGLGERLYLANINLAIEGNQPSWVWFSDLPENNTITWGFESGTDLVTTAASAVISSAAASFQTRNIKVGDPFFIKEGSDIGEYVVASIDSETQITLTVTLSNTDTANDFWVGGNFLAIQTNDSDVITGLAKWSSSLLIFKRDSLYRFDRAASTALPVKNVPGTTSQRSVTEVGNFTFYFHPSGIWRYSGTTSELISNPLQDYLDGVTTANYSEIVGWSSDRTILKMYLGDITNTNVSPELTLTDAVWCYDTQTDLQWMETKERAITAKTQFIESSSINHYVGSDDATVNQIDTGNALGTTDMGMNIETHPYFIVSPEVKVPITRIKIFTKRMLGTQVRYKLYYDKDNTIQADFQDFVTSDIKENESDFTLPAGSLASGIGFSFGESSQNIGPIIERIAIYYLPERATT